MNLTSNIMQSACENSRMFYVTGNIGPLSSTADIVPQNANIDTSLPGTEILPMHILIKASSKCVHLMHINTRYDISCTLILGRILNVHQLCCKFMPILIFGMILIACKTCSTTHHCSNVSRWIHMI